jgi:hypothetical protein
MSKRIKPHQVRGREVEEVREKDPDGRIVYHQRTVDTLGKMLKAGTSTQEMHDAAKDFQAAFIVANLDPLRALPILRVPGTGREPDLNERQLHARRRVQRRCRRSAAFPARPAAACGTSSVCSGACASGRCARAGAVGRCDRSRRRGFQWQHSGCWRRTSVWRGQAGLLKGGRAGADNHGRCKIKLWLADPVRRPSLRPLVGCSHFELPRDI